jgi:hypothetical protein
MQVRIPKTIREGADRRAIVLGEANSAGELRGKFEAMAKRRYQDPKPKREGNFWYLLTWEDGPQGTRKRNVKSWRPRPWECGKCKKSPTRSCDR